jgi:hypothetical protein
MGIIFNFGNKPEKMQPGEKITFGKLDFIADWFGDLRLQQPEPTNRRRNSHFRSALLPPN